MFLRNDYFDTEQIKLNWIFIFVQLYDIKYS